MKDGLLELEVALDLELAVEVPLVDFLPLEASTTHAEFAHLRRDRSVWVRENGVQRPTLVQVLPVVEGCRVLRLLLLLVELALSYGFLANHQWSRVRGARRACDVLRRVTTLGIRRIFKVLVRLSLPEVILKSDFFIILKQ